MINFVDDENYEYQLDFKKYPKNIKIYRFHKRNKNTINNIRRFFKNKGLKIEILSSEYINADSRLKVKYSCGCICDISWHELQDRLGDNCAIHTKFNSNRKITKDKAKELFAEYGYTMIEEYKNANTYIKCKDKYGYIGRMSYSDLKLGKVIKKFNFSESYINYNIKHLYKCKVL